MGIKVIEIQRTAIDRFKQSWPCHGIHNDVDLIMAAFADGDLIDFDLIDADDVELERARYSMTFAGEGFYHEATGAMAALLQDAERYAIKRPTAPGMIDGGYIYK